MNLLEMRQKRAAKVQEMRSLLTKVETEQRSDFNEQEQEQYNTLKTEVDTLSRSIQREEELQGYESGLDARGGRRIPPPTPAQLPEGEFRSLADFISETVANPHSERLTNYRSQTTQTGSLGGFLIPPEFSRTILSDPAEESIIRPRALILPPGEAPYTQSVDDSDNNADQDIYNGVKVSWIDEGEVGEDSEVKLRTVSWEPKKMSAYLDVPNETLRTGIDFSGDLSRRFVLAIRAAEERRFVKGDGVGKPHGYLNHPVTLAVKRITANKVGYKDVVAMYAKAKHSRRLIWLVTHSVLPELMTMTNDAGQLIWQANARDGAVGTLLGIQVFTTTLASALGSKGDVQLIDPFEYHIRDGINLYIESSAHQKFKEDMTVFKVIFKVDGKPYRTKPITRDHETISPFVVLDKTVAA